MRFVYAALLAAICLLYATVAHAELAPIPQGFELPVIDHPIHSNRQARDKVRVLSNLVATEPEVVKNFEKEQAAAAAAAAEDTWNGEEDPEGNHNLAHQADLKEMKALQKLIVHGKKILRVLPAKIKRLNSLKAKAAHFLKAKAKREALEKLEKQETLLKAIRSKESAVAKRLKSLHLSQNKLSGSITKIKKILNKGKKVAKKAPAVAKRTKNQAAKGGKTAGAFIESEVDAQQEAEQSVETELLGSEEAPAAQAEDEFNLADL